MNPPIRKTCEEVGLSFQRPFRICKMTWNPDLQYSWWPSGDDPDSREQQGIFISIPGGCGRHHIPRHNHEFWEITLIQDGSATHTHDGQKHTLGPGDVLVMGPEFAHSYQDIHRLTSVNVYLQPQWLVEDLRALWCEDGLVRFLLADALLSKGASDSWVHLHTTEGERALWSLG
jgi:uncharacterized cupin superfamily protein